MLYSSKQRALRVFSLHVFRACLFGVCVLVEAKFKANFNEFGDFVAKFRVRGLEMYGFRKSILGFGVFGCRF